MHDIIQLLPESLSNQIAAGEVIQRPASVVKELLENAIDAESKSITLIVKDAGRSLVQVIDNGIGMSETDARMSFERHATSKIKKTDDLFSIRTLGFRGEALASIAAIAYIELKTKRQQDDIGLKICIEGSTLKEQEPIAVKNGTSISVKNLFFNVPARRNFLKSNPVELRHITEEFHRIALANPEVEMIFCQNDLETYRLPEGKPAKRIVALMGKNYKEQLLPCEEQVQHIHIKGYIGKPESAKKTRGDQFFFVNDRFIKHHYLHHAVMAAYEKLLQEGTYPFYALFIYIDPKYVDVNIHPTKTEVKFEDERTIYPLIKAIIKQALSTGGIAPSLDFGLNVNFGNTTTPNIPTDSSSHSNSKFSFPKENSSRQKSNLRNWERLYPDNSGSLEQEEPFFEQQNIPKEVMTPSLTFSSSANEINTTEQKIIPSHQNEKFIVEVQDKYILTKVKSGLMLIDRQSAYERILFDRFTQQLESGKGYTQKLLFPVTITLNLVDFTLLTDFKEEIIGLGFSFSGFKNNIVTINGVPSEIHDMDLKQLFEGFIEQIKMNTGEININNSGQVARALVKRIASRSIRNLSNEELYSMIEQLFSSTNPNYTPDGKKIIVIMKIDTLDALFYN